MNFHLELNGTIQSLYFNFYIGEHAALLYWMAITVTLLGAYVITNIAFERIFKTPIAYKKPLAIIGLFLLSSIVIFNVMMKTYRVVGIEKYYDAKAEQEMQANKENADATDMTGYFAFGR